MINAEEHPDLIRARSAREAFVETLPPLIRSLHEGDFELLTDLIFTRLGWVRVSEVGGPQRDVDIILEQPATRERAQVQVKSSADQSVLEDYAKRLAGDDGATTFFVCHTPNRSLSTPADCPHLQVWSDEALAERVIQAGLVDWLFDRTA